jgi:hypothetical protein
VSFDPTALFDVLQSHAMTLGVFDQVNGHEPDNPPGHGVTLAVFAGRVAPVRTSGLASTSARVAFLERIYINAQREPQDGIERDLLSATSALFDEYNGDFELGGNAREVDVFGRYGEPLSAVAGWLDQGDKKFRVMDITVPVIVNDAWEQVA